MVFPRNLGLQAGEVEGGSEAVGVWRLHLEISFYAAYDVGMKRTNIYLSEPSVEKLQTLSEKTGLSVAELIRRAIDDFLKKQK